MCRCCCLSLLLARQMSELLFVDLTCWAPFLPFGAAGAGFLYLMPIVAPHWVAAFGDLLLWQLGSAPHVVRWFFAGIVALSRSVSAGFVGADVFSRQ